MLLVNDNSGWRCVCAQERFWWQNYTADIGSVMDKKLLLYNEYSWFNSIIYIISIHIGIINIISITISSITTIEKKIGDVTSSCKFENPSNKNRLHTCYYYFQNRNRNCWFICLDIENALHNNNIIIIIQYAWHYHNAISGWGLPQIHTEQNISEWCWRCMAHTTSGKWCFCRRSGVIAFIGYCDWNWRRIWYSYWKFRVRVHMARSSCETNGVWVKHRDRDRMG